MLKVGSKRRRTKTEMLTEKEESAFKEQAIQDKLDQFEKMAEQVKVLEKENEKNSNAATVLNELFTKGELTQDD